MMALTRHARAEKMQEDRNGFSFPFVQESNVGKPETQLSSPGDFIYLLVFSLFLGPLPRHMEFPG